MQASALKECGLSFRPDFITDSRFYAALLLAPPTLILINFLLPAWGGAVGARLVLIMVLWQPLVEELLFRGLIQGWLIRQSWARPQFAGISAANLIAATLFALAHLPHHALIWSAAVILPSLIFGYFRERHHHIYSALILHAAYNACYLVARSFSSSAG